MVTANGFQPTMVQGVVPRAGDSVRADATMEVGSVSKEVTVSGSSIRTGADPVLRSGRYRNWQLDGANIMDNGSNSTLNVYPSVDVISHVQVLTSNYGA